MGHNIIKLEQELKDQYEKDRSDPHLYTCIKNLAEAIMVVKKKVDNSDDIDGIAHELATELYFRVNNPNKPRDIFLWTKYIMVVLQGFINGYMYWNHYKEYVIIDDPIEQYEFRKMLYDHTRVYDDQDLRDAVTEIPKIIRKTYDIHTRYYKDSQEYKDTLISLYYSIYHGELTIYGNTDKRVLKYLYMKTLASISTALRDNPNRLVHNVDYIKLFELDISGGNDD